MRAFVPDLNEFYFGLLRSGLHPLRPFVPQGPIDAEGWQTVCRLAARQGTTGIVLDGIGTLPEALRPGREMRIRWAVQADAIAKRHRKQVEVARQAARLLASHGIRMLVLKGIGLSAHYPVPEHRECGDVDLYLFGAQAAGDRLLCAAGARLIDEVPKHTGLVWHGVHLENHRNFLNVSRNREERELDALLSEILQREDAVPSADGFFTPSATFNAIYLVRHAALHFLKEGISARHLCDWSCFLEREGSRIDRDLLAATLKRYRMERFERLLTGAAIRCCGLPEAMPDLDPRILDRFIGEVLVYRPAPKDESHAARFWRKLRTPGANCWRFRLLEQSLAAYYRDTLLAQRRERFTLFR
ncbi:nucleotidyltransferase family protein [Alistipes sp.]|uniref:nucleotidyltransferase domain-containing protein n=1 Tax=Alistipes sp. TaxID=1872444 RepID=UPI003AF11A44